MDVRIPNLGDGIDHATVISVVVSTGEKIEKDQTLIELETEKATAPIPSPYAGTVEKILVKVGDKVTIGALIASVTSGEAASPVTAPVIAGALPRAVAASVPVTSGPQPSYQYVSLGGFPPPASPSVRRAADQLGLDLTRVKGSEAGGRIILEDLRQHVAWLQSVAFSGAPGAAASSATPAQTPKSKVDFSKWGTISRKPLSSLRKKIGERMTEAWRTIPHVTQFDEADLTRVLELRKKHNPAYQKKNANLTPTVFTVAAVVKALKKFPQFNASLDELTGEIILKEYYNIGVAVDTEAGLIVPVVKNADRKTLLEIALEMAALAEKCRKRTVSIEELQGGTFTISNLGSLGVGAFTPIVNSPEVAILAMARGGEKPVVRDQKIVTRSMLPLGLSYDHRVIDGADGARFIREVVGGLESFEEESL